MLLELKRIKRARADFWFYCKTIAPEFYTDFRPHLKRLCDTLQQFWEKRLLKPSGEPYDILIIELPPRHGKTRTLVNFCTWILGLDTQLKILTAAYNDDFATDFSRFVRDAIAEERNAQDHFIYHDIFPDTIPKRGDSSFHKWALEGSFFTFKSTGKGGGVTGKGGNLLLIDDPVKDAIDALNANQLKKDRLWYTGTWTQRKESGAREIINHTPWAKDDIGGFLQINFPDECFVLKMPAFNEETGKMLCSDLLSLKEYRRHERIMEPIIFDANYRLIRVDVQGLLYGSEWKTYTDLPKDEEGHALPVETLMVCDPADSGSDFLCAVWGMPYNEFFYVTDVYYTQESVESTEPELARRIVKAKTNVSRIEANAAGRVISVHVEQQARATGWFSTSFEPHSQTQNKLARILANAKQVKERIVFPADWAARWPKFFGAVTTFQKQGKNAHDDAPDTLTQVVEFLQEREGDRVEINIPIA